MFTKSASESDSHSVDYESRSDLHSALHDDQPDSIISQGLSVVGNISTDGNLHINGSVEGEIRASVLIVGKDASVRADIYADDVVISGSVEGSIQSDKVRLANTAIVDGTIRHRLFAIEAGARFEGQVHHVEEVRANETAATSQWGADPTPTSTTSDSSSDDEDDDGYGA